LAGVGLDTLWTTNQPDTDTDTD